MSQLCPKSQGCKNESEESVPFSWHSCEEGGGRTSLARDKNPRTFFMHCCMTLGKSLTYCVCSTPTPVKGSRDENDLGIAGTSMQCMGEPDPLQTGTEIWTVPASEQLSVVDNTTRPHVWTKTNSLSVLKRKRKGSKRA